MHFFKSYFLIVVLMILTATTSKVYAAFPIQSSQAAAATATETVAHQTDVDFKALVNNAIERFTQKPAPAYSDGMGADASLGVASFGVGLAGLIALVAAVALNLPILLALAVPAGIAAIILGAMGLRRSKRGFAIAGMVMGIVNVSILLMALLLTLLILAMWNGY